MANPANINRMLYEGRGRESFTASATLTAAQCRDKILTLSTGTSDVALTLPTVTTVRAGSKITCVCSGANAGTIVSPTGFGTAGSSTVTLADGAFAEVFFDGTYAYSLSHTAPA
jgi:hypothetical protein